MVVGWVLWMVPVLCAGGALSHPCDCGAWTGCGHEDGCASDPCGTIALRDEWLGVDLDHGVPGLPAEKGGAAVETPEGAGSRPIRRFREAFPRPHPPFPASDIPFRI